VRAVPAEQLRVAVDGAQLAASYSPAGDRVLVALQGASEGTRDFALYQHLHDVLPPLGVGVVTFDRRGEGSSTGERSADRFPLQAADCRAVLDALNEPVTGLWAYSQGGWVAPLVATMDARVSLVVALAACGVTPRRQMLYGVGRHLSDAGFDAAVVDRALALRQRFADAMGGVPGDEDDLDAALRAASTEDWWPLVYLPGWLPDEEADRREWVEAMEHDPAPSLRALQVPALALYGSHDEWTPVAESAEVWRAALGDRVEVVVLDGLGHDLREPDGTVSPRYEDVLVGWLDGQGWVGARSS
jgi:pimeloyl-ACP methyl ester carboxylesterase